MKRSILLTAAGVTLAAAIVACFRFAGPAGDALSRGSARITEDRPAITFIMGDDRTAENQYYLRATWYFRCNSADSTSIVETSLRSLTEVRDQIVALAAKNGKPWGVVNIVTHGNPWTGMSMTLFPGGERVTREAMTAAVDAGIFAELPANVVDRNTEIRILGCAIGRDQNLVEQVAQAFASASGKPRVQASHRFQSFQVSEENGRMIDCRKIEADAWHLFVRKGDLLADTRVAREFATRYPGSDLDWKDALQRTQPRFPGDVYAREFDVPVEWIVTYECLADIPDVRTMKARLSWLSKQKELREYVESVGIPAEKFLWDVREISHITEQGDDLPALRARGTCTVVCVLRAA